MVWIIETARSIWSKWPIRFAARLGGSIVTVSGIAGVFGKPQTPAAWVRWLTTDATIPSADRIFSAGVLLIGLLILVGPGTLRSVLLWRPHAQGTNLTGGLRNERDEAIARAEAAESSQRRLRDEVLPEWQRRAESAEAKLNESQKEAGVEIVSTPKPLPDERSVILFRRYLVLAHEALLKILNEQFAQCFDRGGWPGLAAALAKYSRVSEANEARDAVELCLEGRGEASFEDAFATFYVDYSSLLSLAWNFSKGDLPTKQDLLRKWFEADSAFVKEFLDLSAGLNREWLTRLGKQQPEGRDALRGLLLDPRLNDQ